jgi:hypothetical protein
VQVLEEQDQRRPVGEHLNQPAHRPVVRYRRFRADVRIRCRAQPGADLPPGGLQARPIYARKRDSIDAHLTIVFAALAITRLIEERTGWTIKRFVRTTRRYRTVHIRAGQHILTAEDPLPDELRTALARIN